MNMESQNGLSMAGPPPSVIAGDYLGVFKRRAWTIIVPFVVCTVIGGVVAHYTPKQYRAVTTVEVVDRTVIDQFFRDVAYTLPYKPYLTTIAAVIQTRNFLSDLVTQCGINEGFDSSSARERSRLLDRVRENTSVKLITPENKNGSDLIEITYTGREAEKVMSFVNAVREKYTKQVMDNYLAEIQTPMKLFEKKKDEAKRAYDKATANYESFQQREEFPSEGERDKVAKTRELSELKKQVEDDETTLKGLEQELEYTTNALGGVPDTIAGEVSMKPNPLYEDQQKKIEVLKRELDLAQKRYTSQHPAVKKGQDALEREMEALKSIEPSVKGESKLIANDGRSNLETRRRDLERQIDGLNVRIKRTRERIPMLQSQVDALPSLLKEDKRLKDEVLSTRVEFDKWNGSYQRALNLYNRTNSSDGAFFKPLRVPVREDTLAWDPVFPNNVLFLGIGAFIGLLIGAGIAFVAEFGSRSYVTVGQVRRTLPVPLLGQVGRIQHVDTEAKGRNVRRLAVLGCSFLVLAVAAVHVLYFAKPLRMNLPVWLYDILGRIYGA